MEGSSTRRHGNRARAVVAFVLAVPLAGAIVAGAASAQSASATSSGATTASTALAASTSSGGIGPYAGRAPAFDATFGGTALDNTTWQTCYPWEDSAAGCTNFGNSQEEEWYLPAQDQVSGGALHMVATQTPTSGTTKTGTPATYPYRSGMVTTHSSFDFTYGYVQVTARLPGGTGTWPGLWLLPQNESWPPEVDIMENWGTANTIRCTFHFGTASNPQQTGKAVTSASNLTAGWHTYGLLWEPGSLTWYLDGQEVFSYTGSAVPSQPMYFLANLAIDGSAPSPSSFDIQSVQIYDSSSTPISTTPGTGGSGSSTQPGTGAGSSPSHGQAPAGSTGAGYDLVGADGGVFAFNSPGTSGGFFGSLPADGINVDDIVGMQPTANDQGYFLVGRDGGVFAFGNAPFLGSLPADGINVDDIVGIAPTATGGGYWEVGANGEVYAFGNALDLGSATGTASPVTGITATTGGSGYWVVTQDGGVHPFGDATSYGSLPSLGVTPARPVIGLVPTTGGYRLVGSDGGIFAFGDAPFAGSLPQLDISVNDIVGAVPTTT